MGITVTIAKTLHKELSIQSTILGKIQKSIQSQWNLNDFVNTCNTVSLVRD